MKNFLPFFWILVLSFMGCTPLKERDLKKIEGYWMIDFVQAHGEVFQPKGSAPAVDYYHFFDQNKGTKIKMTPLISGMYQRSEDQASFVIQQIDNRFYLHFFDALTPWKEEIITISENELVLFHQDKAYHYKRHQKINL